MYMFYYQNAESVMSVHQSEESAKEQVKYYTNNHAYKNKHYYVKHRLVNE